MLTDKQNNPPTKKPLNLTAQPGVINTDSGLIYRIITFHVRARYISQKRVETKPELKEKTGLTFIKWTQTHLQMNATVDLCFLKEEICFFAH